MNKETIKRFIAWLESASVEEIQQHQEEILEHRSKIRFAEGRADVRLALRLIDEELLARYEVGRKESH